MKTSKNTNLSSFDSLVRELNKMTNLRIKAQLGRVKVNRRNKNDKNKKNVL